MKMPSLMCINHTAGGRDAGTARVRAAMAIAAMRGAGAQY